MTLAPDDDATGEVEEEPGDKPPPVEWTDPEFPDTDDDVEEDTHDDVTEVDAT